MSANPLALFPDPVLDALTVRAPAAGPTRASHREPDGARVATTAAGGATAPATAPPTALPTPYREGARHTLYRGDAAAVLRGLPDASVQCIVTSPPYYGQRDYGEPDQLGLEAHPSQYVEKLVAVFREAARVLDRQGSLWVNLGDTYWSGKGQPRGPDHKQRNRRFVRPQDRSGPRPLCTPKQLLLIPHRFAIAMQDAGWVVRNDNVWHKSNPTPDPANDRSAAAHEYMFHFVRGRRYRYRFTAVAQRTQDGGRKPVPSVWSLQTPPNFKKHIAVFPETLVRVPILATLPAKGTILDPFCGSATALSVALATKRSVRAIGIDVSGPALDEADALLRASLEASLEASRRAPSRGSPPGAAPERPARGRRRGGQAGA